MPRQINRTVLVLPCVLVFFDQLVKFAVINGGFNYSLNNGLPILNDIYISKYFYFIFGITLILLFHFIRRTTRVNVDFPYALILSGIISNLIDRFIRGGVVDYINLRIWPNFNLSDALIVIGVIFFMTKVLSDSPKT